MKPVAIVVAGSIVVAIGLTVLVCWPWRPGTAVPVMAVPVGAAPGPPLAESRQGQVPSTAARVGAQVEDPAGVGVPSQVAAGPGDRTPGLDFLLDPAVPMQRREAAVQALGAAAVAGDRQARRVLQELADRYVYLNRAAITHLAAVREPEVQRYLLSRLGDVGTNDVEMLCATVRAAAAALGREAVGPISEVMAKAWERGDGHSPIIADCCAAALGGLGDAAAVPALDAALSRVMAQARPDLARGAVIVQALGASDPGRLC